jgi:serine/threonine protein kinase
MGKRDVFSKENPMTEALRCPHCGIDLEADAPQGLCPSCLLEEGMKDPGDGPWSRALPETTPYTIGFTPPEVADLAQRFPQLEILALLGYGGMGAVYKARQVRLDRLVALKVLPAEASRDPSFAERFTREARALARLNHPHIVGVHDFGEHEGLFYFIMEYVDGANLRRLLADGPLSPALALQIIPQICDALQYAHEEGIVHRDIKPENILLDQKGRVKIADFGLAKLLGQAPLHTRLTASRQVMGTPHYMAPEQMERPLTVDHRADIYSLGVVFYEMLTGELPLGRFAPPSHKAGVDERLDAVVFRALENQAERRYQRVSDLQRDVAALSAGSPVIYRPDSHAHQPEVLPAAPALSVAFQIKRAFWQTQGILRLQEQGLDVEFVHHFLFTSGRVREKTISLHEIKTISLKKSWSTASLILTAHRLSTLEDFAITYLDRAEFLIGKANRQAAEELVAQVQRRLAALTPQPAGQGMPDRAARPRASSKPARLGAFIRSVLYYCVDSFQSRKPPSSPPTELSQPQVPASQAEDQPADLAEDGPPSQSRWLRTLQQILLLVCFGCLLCALSFQASGGRDHTSFQIGFPSPWWTLEQGRHTVESEGASPDKPGRKITSFKSSAEVNFLSSSFGLLVVGLVALHGAWLMEKRLLEHGLNSEPGKRLSRRGKWRWVVVWILLAVLVTEGIVAVLSVTIPNFSL